MFSAPFLGAISKDFKFPSPLGSSVFPAAVYASAQGGNTSAEVYAALRGCHMAGQVVNQLAAVVFWRECDWLVPGAIPDACGLTQYSLI